MRCCGRVFGLGFLFAVSSVPADISNIDAKSSAGISGKLFFESRWGIVLQGPLSRL